MGYVFWSETLVLSALEEAVADTAVVALLQDEVRHGRERVDEY